MVKKVPVDRQFRAIRKYLCHLQICCIADERNRAQGTKEQALYEKILEQLRLPSYRNIFDALHKKRTPNFEDIELAQKIELLFDYILLTEKQLLPRTTLRRRARKRKQPQGDFIYGT